MRHLSRSFAIPLWWWSAGLSALGAAAVLSHEWWRDEAYTWLVVASSPTVGDLVANLGFNGHPRAYYMMVWVLHQIAPAPLLLSFLNLVAALAAVLLFMKSAPVTRPQAAAFSIGFYPFYQYGVISRPYAFIMYALFLYCHLHSVRPRAVCTRLLILAFMAQIHLLAAIASGMLAVYEVATNARRPLRQWLAVSAVPLSILIVYWQMTPPASQIPQMGATDLASLLRGVANGFLPNYGFTNDGGMIQRFVQGPAGLVLFWGTLGVLLARHRRALFVYGLLCGGMALVSIFVYAGHRWHHGFYFLFFFVALWISGGPPLDRFRSCFVTFVLTIHLLFGVYAVGADMFLPYSTGKQAARLLREEGMHGMPIVGILGLQDSAGNTIYRWEVDRIQPVLLYLGAARAYDPVTGSYESFFKHYLNPRHSPNMDSMELQRSIDGVAQRIGPPFVVVAVAETSLDLPAPLRGIGSLSVPIDYGERYHVFLYPAVAP